VNDGDVATLNTEHVASETTRRRIVVTSLVFTYVLITLLVVYGSPTNSLHESALAWAFGTNILVMFAYSFGTLLTKYVTK
jgi:hypothetical protein